METQMTSMTSVTAIPLAALFAGAITAGLTAPPATAQDPNHLLSFTSYLCLEPENKSTEQGAAVVQWPCDNSEAQGWYPVPMGGGIYHFRNDNTPNMCLDARGRAANETSVQLWTCNEISNENWEIGNGNGTLGQTLISRVSGTHSYCLDVPDQQQTWGLPMWIYRCNETVAQQWEVGGGF
jgi:Ricin-type beta-trefoil lectin domain